jgi:hypothetical protein
VKVSLHLVERCLEPQIIFFQHLIVLAQSLILQLQFLELPLSLLLEGRQSLLNLIVHLDLQDCDKFLDICDALKTTENSI